MKSDTKFLIVGLGLIGGCYARRLTALGHRVCALDTDPDAIAYALRLRRFFRMGWADLLGMEKG